MKEFLQARPKSVRRRKSVIKYDELNKQRKLGNSALFNSKLKTNDVGNGHRWVSNL